MVTPAALASAPRIVVFDMSMTAASPAGSCVLAEINGLADAHRVLAVAGDLLHERAPNIEWLRIPLPSKPVLLRYLVFHALAPLAYVWWRLRGGQAAVVQATQGQFPPADIAYAHFCHRAYLQHQWRDSTVSGPRRWARWLSHRFNAWCEARAFARCRVLVVPSQGLAREIAREYPDTGGKIEVIANPVALERFARPADFDRAGKRRELGFGDADLVLSFMALGDFERKGLGLLVEALGSLGQPERRDLKLLVVGGQPGEIETFVAQARAAGVADRLVFVGLQEDVRPCLWASDVFALPSSYETFSLAAFQAAAAGLPVMVSQGLYGPEDLIAEGENGWQVPRDSVSLGRWMRALLSERHRLAAMSGAATASVRPYSVAAFTARWQALYRRLLAA